MGKITVFISLFLLIGGTVSAEMREFEPDPEEPEEVQETAVGHRIEEITLQQGILQKIRAEGKKAPVEDLSQSLEDSSESEDLEMKDTEINNYDANVNKLFDNLY